MYDVAETRQSLINDIKDLKKFNEQMINNNAASYGREELISINRQLKKKLKELKVS